MAFEVQVESGAGACVARLHGDIDIAVVPALKTEFTRALDAGCSSVVFDLSDVEYADSSALGLIVWLDHRLRPDGGRLVLAGANSDVARILELSGLVQVAASVTTSTSVGSALEGLAMPISTSGELWRHELEVPASVDTLGPVRENVVELIKPLGFGESALFDIKVALGEALANAVRHGSRDAEDARVRVSVAAYADRAVIEVMDSGSGFDGEHSASDDVYAPSGRGVMFMRALMDRVEFERAPLGGTLVRLVKHRPLRAGSVAS